MKRDYVYLGIIALLLIIFGIWHDGSLNVGKSCVDTLEKCTDDLKETLDEQEIMVDILNGLVCEDGLCWSNNTVWIEGEGFCYKHNGRILCPK